MDAIKLTRELGKAIQADERYKKVLKAIERNEADLELSGMVEKMQAIQIACEAAVKAGKKDDELAVFEKDFTELHGKIMGNESMKNYAAVKKELDEFVKYLIQILVLCSNGANPETCDPNNTEKQ